MSDHLRNDAAQMAALFVQSILFGAYMLTFVEALVTIFFSEGWNLKPRSKIQWATFSVACLMWINGTLNLALAFLRIMQVFVYQDNTSIQKLGSAWLNLAKSVNVVLQLMLADGMLVYRCWIIYNSSFKIVVFPVLMWILGAICGGYMIYGSVVLSLGSRLNAPLYYKSGAGLWGSTVGLNIYSTLFIVYRIWRVQRGNRRFSAEPSLAISGQRRNTSQLQAVVKIIVESNLIYTATSITVFASALAKSNAIYITTAADIIIIGITFNLIIIRVDKERAKSRFGERQAPVSTLKFRPVDRQEAKEGENTSPYSIGTWCTHPGGVDADVESQGTDQNGPTNQDTDMIADVDKH